jgi:hypothetical protein
LPLYTNSGFTKPKFDKNIGDEAKSIKLSAAVTFDGVAYKNSDLTDYAKSFIKSKQKTQDIDFAENSIKNTVKNSKAKNEKEAQASVLIEAGLLPKINTEDVLKQIKDAPLKKAELILSEFPQIDRSKILFSPNIPLLPNIFFRLPNNISIEMESE